MRQMCAIYTFATEGLATKERLISEILLVTEVVFNIFFSKESFETVFFLL